MEVRPDAANGSSSEESRDFTREVHDIVRDLMHPNPAIYWTDFLLTVSVAYAAFVAFQFAPDFTLLQAGALALSGLAIYRAVAFIHEIAHQPSGALAGFTFIWNLLCGIPALMPSFLYGDHKSHHANHSYGTRSDAEYVFVTSGKLHAMVFLLLSFLYPLLGPLRFLLLTPVAALIPGADRIVWRWASSLYMMNPAYRREYDSAAFQPNRWLQEAACCLWAWCIVWLTWTGHVSSHALVKTYVVFLFWIGLNQIRTLAAHRYTSNGLRRNHLGQLLDSNTFAGGALPSLWAPLGLRYHALHHAMPLLPYHSMGKAHRRLMRRLPSESRYHKTLQAGLCGALGNVLLMSGPGKGGPVHSWRLPRGEFAQTAAKEEMMPKLSRDNRAK
jgi:fatty acid desaturase